MNILTACWKKALSRKKGAIAARQYPYHKKGHQDYTMMINAIFIDTKSHSAEVLEIDGEPDTIKKLLGCRFLDFTRRYIGTRQYMIVLDDESFLKEGAVPSAMLQDGTIDFSGNLLICNFTADGDLKSLTEEDVTGIMQSVIYVKGNPVITVRG